MYNGIETAQNAVFTEPTSFDTVCVLVLPEGLGMHLKNDARTGLAVAAMLFALNGLMQLYRLISHFSVSVGGYEIPLSVNIVGLAIVWLMAFWLWSLRK